MPKIKNKRFLRCCLCCENTITDDNTICFFCINLLNNDHDFKQHIINFVKSTTRKHFIMKRECEVCGSKKVQLHIKNYFRPLDIKWLCKNHHNDEHNWHKDFLESKLC